MSELYARRWRRAWSTWAAVTLVVALVVWSTSAVLLLLVTGVVLTTMLITLLRSGTVPDDAVLDVRAVLGDGTRWTVLGVAVIATGLVQVELAVLVLTAIAVSSPQVVRLFLGSGHGSGPGVGPWSSPKDVTAALQALDLRHAQEAVDRLDLAGLCWAWSRSATLLGQLSEVRARAAVVALRGLYLDEMERRDPAGFATWLGSDSSGAGSPERFLAGPPEDGRRGGLAA